MTISIVTSWRERRAREFRRDGVDEARARRSRQDVTIEIVIGARRVVLGVAHVRVTPRPGSASRRSTSAARRGNDADVSDAEDDSARADDDFGRHVLARTPRARVSVETASTPGAQRRLRSRRRLRPGLERGRRTGNRPRARRRSGGRRRGFRRLRADSPLFSRRGPTRGVPSRRRRLARRLSRLGFLSPSRLHEVRGDGVARGRVSIRARTARRSASRTRRRRRPSWTIRRRARGTGRCTRCWRASHPRGRRRSRPGKRHRRGETARFRRARDGGSGRDAARDPYAFTAEIRRILDAVR